MSTTKDTRFKELEWKQTDRRTDGGDCITSRANAVGKDIVAHCSGTSQLCDWEGMQPLWSYSYFSSHSIIRFVLSIVYVDQSREITPDNESD